MPQVSVLMTVYNGMPYLPAAVESILRQTLQDFQFVIVNDGSQDSTLDYLNELNDPRILILTQANGGTAAAANHGLAECDTQFTARMDADDIALPTRLEKQHAFLLSHPEVGMVGTQVAPLGERRIGKSLNLPVQHEVIVARMQNGHHGLAHSSIMFRTQLLRDLGGYWKFRLIDDWDMMLRMAEVARVANLNEILHHYRIHGGSLNGSSMRRMREHIAFACERARCRREQRPEIEFDEFQGWRASRPWWRRVNESVVAHALGHYRLALADILGNRPVRGYVRLAWAAACCPTWTLRRLGRRFHVFNFL